MSVLALLSFRGSSTLRAWWIVVLGVAATEAALSILLTGQAYPINPQLPLETRIIGAMINTALLWPIAAVSVRRARGLGISPWPVVGLLTINLLGGLAFAFIPGWIGMTAVVGAVAALYWLGFRLGLPPGLFARERKA